MDTAVAVTAKVALDSKVGAGDDQTALTFRADYNDGRNKEWAKYTPALTVQMTVLNSVADQFDVSGKYTLTFTPE